jgi:hypothetical protein
VSTAGNTLEVWFREGVDAARSGQRARARELFRRVVQGDEEHYLAWLWLAGVTEGEEQQACLARVRALGDNTSHVPSALPGSMTGEAGRRGVSSPRMAALRAHLVPHEPALVALVSLVAISLAELLTIVADPRLGLGLHCLILAVLFVEIALAKVSASVRPLLVTLALLPLIRILGLSLPLGRFPMLYWYLIISVPLFAAVWVAGRTLGYSWQELGLTLSGWPRQLLIGLSGLVFGAVEYAMLRPRPLVATLNWAAILQAALILLVCTGLLEELIFRGLLQRSASDALGRWGMPYAALLFAVLHLGYGSLLNVAFVLGVGLFFGAVVQRTRSLLGVTLAHGLTNIMLFLALPFVLG